MTESKWLSCYDPGAMLRHLTLSGISDRKLRLFLVACCRSVLHLMQDPRSRAAVDAADHFADGMIGVRQLAAAHTAAQRAFAGAEARFSRYGTVYNASYLTQDRTAALIVKHVSEAAMFTATAAPTSKAYDVCLDAAGATAGATQAPNRYSAHKDQCVLLRDIFGNPFCRLTPRSFPAHAIGLAEACYAAFPTVNRECYDILADALADLGEDSAATHCRDEIHVKGCHVLDWILKRE